MLIPLFRKTSAIAVATLVTDPLTIVVNRILDYYMYFLLCFLSLWLNFHLQMFVNCWT
jgi:hypothetical protein